MSDFEKKEEERLKRAIGRHGQQQANERKHFVAPVHVPPLAATPSKVTKPPPSPATPPISDSDFGEDPASSPIISPRQAHQQEAKPVVSKLGDNDFGEDDDVPFVKRPAAVTTKAKPAAPVEEYDEWGEPLSLSARQAKANYSVVVTSCDMSDRVAKALHLQLGVGLTSAKEIVRHCPAVVAKNVSEEKARRIADDLEAAGACVTVGQM